MQKKGFTLIELLIVIAIIGILAVAFLPNILQAPAKGRDATRIADLQKIQQVIINKNLAGKAYPSTTGFISTGLTYGSSDWGSEYTVDFGGLIPEDPLDSNGFPSAIGTGTKGRYFYAYSNGPTGDQPLFTFGLYAHMEIYENANASCSSAKTAGTKGTQSESNPDDWCYVILYL